MEINIEILEDDIVIISFFFYEDKICKIYSYGTDDHKIYTIFKPSALVENYLNELNLEIGYA